ncbi:MAG TPA: hypothetical protein VJH34_03205 [archaeon]|nr:hypothetical protein [archaeon]
MIRRQVGGWTILSVREFDTYESLGYSAGSQRWEHYGKWVIVDKVEHIREYAMSLMKFLEKGDIHRFEYSDNPAKNVPSGYDDDCHLLVVYADDREKVTGSSSQKDRVQTILSQVTGFDKNEMFWVYDRDDLEDSLKQ